MLFQRQAQDQGSFGVGIVCGQCHKGLILGTEVCKANLAKARQLGRRLNARGDGRAPADFCNLSAVQWLQ